MILSITCLAVTELLMEFIWNFMVFFYLMSNFNTYWYHFCKFANEMISSYHFILFLPNKIKWWVPNEPLGILYSIRPILFVHSIDVSRIMYFDNVLLLVINIDVFRYILVLDTSILMTSSNTDRQECYSSFGKKGEIWFPFHTLLLFSGNNKALQLLLLLSYFRATYPVTSFHNF
jgi:hypothetical protein